MEPTYKVIECSSFDVASFLLSEYQELEYNIVWVDVINAGRYVYYIVHKDGQIPECIAIEAHKFHTWYRQYGVCPEMDEVIVEQLRGFDGYVTSTSLIVWADPDEMEEVNLQ